MSRPQPASAAPGPAQRTPLEVIPGVRRRQVRRLAVRVSVVLLAGLFMIGMLQAVVTQAQGRIDQLNTQLDDAADLDRQLRLQRAALLSPARLVTEARDRLGMVPPETIRYLTPSPAPAP